MVLNKVFIRNTEEGTLIGVHNYENGVKQGIEIYYEEDGTVLSETLYVNGKMNGIKNCMMVIDFI